LDNLIKKTADGSDTLISRQFDQPYHSLGGAVAESRYVYFEANGLIDSLKSSEDITILEIGFGSGLNLILLLEYIQKLDSNVHVTFYSVEAFPIKPETAATINFGDDVEVEGYSSLLKEIFSDLEPGWNSFSISDKVDLHLFFGTFEAIDLSVIDSIDFILHDPFSPDSNPDGWTPELFSKIADEAADDAMLSTYSAATSARAAMAVAGWTIARFPGALGKREMTVASKNPEKLSHLKRVNETRLIERYEAGDFE
jgi:tRNA U34 5-methylaminomethyl-2-thiouridine-forming methyltransferase MnmC